MTRAVAILWRQWPIDVIKERAQSMCVYKMYTHRKRRKEREMTVMWWENDFYEWTLLSATPLTQSSNLCEFFPLFFGLSHHKVQARIKVNWRKRGGEMWGGQEKSEKEKFVFWKGDVSTTWKYTSYLKLSTLVFGSVWVWKSSSLAISPLSSFTFFLAARLSQIKCGEGRTAGNMTIAVVIRKKEGDHIRARSLSHGVRFFVSINICFFPCGLSGIRIKVDGRILPPLSCQYFFSTFTTKVW